MSTVFLIYLTPKKEQGLTSISNNSGICFNILYMKLTTVREFLTILSPISVISGSKNLMKAIYPISLIFAILISTLIGSTIELIRYFKNKDQCIQKINDSVTFRSVGPTDDSTLTKSGKKYDSLFTFVSTVFAIFSIFYLGEEIKWKRYLS